MKVLMVNDYARPYGGAETYLFALMELLRARGVEVRLVGDKPRPIHYVSRIFNPWYLVKFLWIVWRWKPDVVHIQKYNLVYSFAPALAARLLGRRTIVTLHDFGLFCPDGWALLPDGTPCGKHLDRRCFGSNCYRSRTAGLGMQRRLNFVRNTLQVAVLKRVVDVFLSPSRLLRDWAAHYYGARSLRLPLFLEAGADPVAPRRDSNALHLFFAGRVVAEKGLQHLLEALPGLDVELEVAGDGPYRAELEAQAERLGICARVRWLGNLPNEQVGARIAAADASVIPSLWVENTPVFAFETMRSGRAILASRIGGLPDLVEDGVTGFLFQPGSAASIRAVLEHLLAQPESVRQAGQAARARLVAAYSPEGHVDRLLAVYRGEPMPEPAA